MSLPIHWGDLLCIYGLGGGWVMSRPRTCILKSLNCLLKPAVMSVGLIFIEGKSRQSTELQISGDGRVGIRIIDRLLLSFLKSFLEYLFLSFVWLFFYRSPVYSITCQRLLFNILRQLFSFFSPCWCSEHLVGLDWIPQIGYRIALITAVKRGFSLVISASRCSCNKRRNIKPKRLRSYRKKPLSIEKQYNHIVVSNRGNCRIEIYTFRLSALQKVMPESEDKSLLWSMATLHHYKETKQKNGIYHLE